MQEKSGAEARRRVRRAANQRFLGNMMDMGIPQEHAELALAETGNVGIEVTKKRGVRNLTVPLRCGMHGRRQQTAWCYVQL
jgi:hypothetical protein